jgi:hypothetical protein
LPPAEIDRFNVLCTDAIRDLLVRGRASTCQTADPTGHHALARAAALRRKLRTLQRRGRITAEIVAELRALAPAAA